MQKMNKPWIFSLWITLGLILGLFSLPLYSDENTSQTGEGSGESAVESSAENNDVSTEPGPTMAAPAEEPDKAPPQSKHVVRALLTTGIENREPVDEIVSVTKNQERIYFFTEFTELKGKMVKHRWDYNGKTMGEVNFNVGSNKWRCYSSKNLLPEWTGIWTVSVIDENNNVLAETYFEVTE